VQPLRRILLPSVGFRDRFQLGKSSPMIRCISRITSISDLPVW
jgi:hypothetical protein